MTTNDELEHEREQPQDAHDAPEATLDELERRRAKRLYLLRLIGAAGSAIGGLVVVFKDLFG
ncbi:hypothetical protein LQ327_09125 [Actinomycetospora endophytica]|uniref:Uncharacterized protein n=1 Tax=Actinomycetospora endophytica TaxID=2291215 RepID=A0ABS8P5M5_9PSEU|nr:hypothetical protein [Actinomycetospora endophytica]MCD2193544.1 hypothetical protein [Actinomycetospora endophytica]